MSNIKYAIGIDISTQAISGMLLGIRETAGMPSEPIIPEAWTSSIPYPDEKARKSPAKWIELIIECTAQLRKIAAETELAEAIGVSTIFPGIFPILNDGSIDPNYVSLYDNTDDAGTCVPELDDALGLAEQDTLNRMWPGNMAIGLVHLVRSCGLQIDNVVMFLPPNSAFAYALLNAGGIDVRPSEIVSDFTETVISGLYHSGTIEPVSRGIENLLQKVLPELSADRLKRLLPNAVPSWRNTIPSSTIASVRTLLGLPNLKAISIGAGDSPLGALALFPDADTIVDVRGSTDSPMLMIKAPRPRITQRETVLHYPLPTAKSLADAPWCAVAPTLRSGKVWDWVRRLRFDDSDTNADRQLERLAIEALERRLTACPGSFEHSPLIFDTALGGERAPDWNSHATGKLIGLVETHGIGDIALAALEGVSVRLRRCLDLMERRYNAAPSKLLLAGDPTRNALWNWITQIYTGKKTFATMFSDASLLGAAMLGYAASYCDTECDDRISRRLRKLSKLVSNHELVRPIPVNPPNERLASMERNYAVQVKAMLAQLLFSPKPFPAKKKSPIRR